ncbi:MAG: hypothetical protein IT370_06145 [Deltaproteobacteria bacterium]|nr:hypothetical protein [Deltaproteobacteria bacterium]
MTIKTALPRAALATLALLACPHPASAVCTPLLDLPFVGDFEITLDPDFPPNLLYVTNVGDTDLANLATPTPHNISVAVIDGNDGTANGAPVRIATNYVGNAGINGPEFLHTTLAGNVMGILFNGPSGVHAAFRPVGAAATQFDVDLLGAGFAAVDEPPALPGTTPFSYPGGGFPDGVSYQSFGGLCGNPARSGSKCYGGLGDGVLAPVDWFAGNEGLTDVYSQMHPTLPGVVILSACRGPLSCGLYRGVLAGGGAMAPAPAGANNTAHFELLTSLGVSHGRRETLRGERIPQSGTIIWAVARVNPLTPNDNTIEFFSESAAGVLTSRHSIPNASKVEHFRLLQSATDLYLDYQVRDVAAAVGSYRVRIQQSAPWAPLGFGAPDHYWTQDPHGVELVWLPGPAVAATPIAYYASASVLGTSYVCRGLLAP